MPRRDPGATVFRNREGPDPQRLEAHIHTVSTGEPRTVTNASGNCVGDFHAVGTSRMRVSGPRGPGHKQERKPGRLPGLHKLALDSRRTVFYARVLEKGGVPTQKDQRTTRLRRPRTSSRALPLVSTGAVSKGTSGWFSRAG